MSARHGFDNPQVDHGNGRLVDHAGLDILTEDECVDLMKHAVVARIGFVEQDEVLILPINITWWDGTVVFSTQRGTKLHAAVMNRSATIEVDGYDEDVKSGWSVVARGRASVITDGRTIDSLDRLGVRGWVRPDMPKHWVQVRIETVSGRQTPSE